MTTNDDPARRPGDPAPEAKDATPGVPDAARAPLGVPGASDAVTHEVTSWPGVTAATGGRGEWSFRLGGHEIGHLHGDRVLHIAFPKAVWHELHDAGRVGHHPVFPGKVGWAARDIRDDDDVRDVVALLRVNYDRVVGRHPVAGG
jgi:hypothetical protein